MTSPTTYKLGFPKLKYITIPMASGAPFSRNPTSADLYDPKAGGFYQIGTIWPNVSTNAIWILGSITGGNTAHWTGLTAAAITKGSSVFVAGVSAAIPAPEVVASSSIVITRTNLAGALTAKGEYLTITPGVGFVVTSGDPADTSAFNWAIVA